MPGKPAVQVVITGDTKGLEKSLKSSAKGLGGFAKTAGGVFTGMLATKAFDVVVDGLKSVASFALDGIDKLDALGDNVARLDGLAKGLGDTVGKTDLTKFGVDKGEAAAAALAIAKTGKSLKLNGKQLARVTPQFTEMAAQLASLGDGDPEKQADLLAKALGGSAKAAKALGIVLPKGKDVTPMQTYAAIMKQLAPKLKEATSGQASLADVGERWDATLANLQLELAGFLEQLAPVITQLMDVFMPLLREFITTVGPIVAELFGRIADAVSGFLADGGGERVAGVFAGIMDVMGRLFDFIATNVVPVVLELAQALADNLAPLIPPLMEVFDALLPVLQRVWGFVGDVVVPLLANVVFPIISKILEIVLKLAAAFLRALGPAIDNLSKDFQQLLDWLKPVFDWLSKVFDIAGDVIGKLGSIHLPSIPGFNAAAPAGATFAAPGVGQLAAGGTVNVTIQTGVGDPVAIGRTVARYLAAYQGRGGTP
jgi:hypothetical protein